MNIQLEKALLIEQLQNVNDIDLIRAVKSLLTYSKKKEEEYKDLEIPEWHKEIVRKRLEDAANHPEKLLSWDDMMKELES